MRCEPQVVAIAVILGICLGSPLDNNNEQTTAFIEQQISPYTEPQPMSCVELQALTLHSYCKRVFRESLGTDYLSISCPYY